MSNKRTEAFSALSELVSDFYTTSSIGILEWPDELAFMRDYVAAYKPCILRGLIDDWPAITKWNEEYLVAATGDRPIPINATPQGAADSIIQDPESGEKVFVYPAEVNMTMRDFFSEIKCRDAQDRAVLYLSQQDNNMIKHFPELQEDIHGFLGLPEKSFGVTGPEAVNIWIGDDRSVSSLHKDHFENLYAVISGEKTFTLFPPTDAPFLHETLVPTKMYVTQSSSSPLLVTDLSMTSEGCPSANISWIPIDPTIPVDQDAYPMYNNAHPLHVTLRPGEVLYIPAMWYHRVSQTKLTVAVNYWYEMSFNFRYVFSQFVRQLESILSGE